MLLGAVLRWCSLITSHTLHWVWDVIVRRLCPLFQEKPQSDSPLTDTRNHVVLQGFKLWCNACPVELLPVERKEVADIVLCVQTKGGEDQDIVIIMT